MNAEVLEAMKLWLTAEGKPQLVVAPSFGLTMFLPIPFRDIVEPFRALFDKYLKLVPAKTFRWQSMGGSTYKAIAPRAFSTIEEWLSLKRSYGSNCAIWLKDGETHLDAGTNLFRLWGSDGYTTEDENDSGFLLILFPTDVISSPGTAKFLSEIHAMVEHLPFHSGYLGYTLNVSTLLTVAPYSDDINKKMFAVGQRFPGVEIVKPHLESYEMKAHLRSPSFTTFLSQPFLERLGGIESIKARLQGDFRFTKLEFGWSIQAGSEPIVGDRNRQIDVSNEQQAVAQLLAPCYSTQPANLFKGRSHDDTLAWLRRFNTSR